MRKSSIRNKLTLAIFVGFLIPYCLGSFYLTSIIKQHMYEDSLESSKQILKQVSKLIDQTYIIQMREDVNMLSSLSSVKNAEEGLNNYTDFDLDSSQYKEITTENGLIEYFQSLKESHATIDYVFFGTESGGYMEYPRFTPIKNYDPRERPWYINAMKTTEVVFSKPYFTKNTKDLVVSASQKVVNNGVVVGVIGISIKLENAQKNIGEIKIGDTGSILVLNSEQLILVSPKEEDWVLKTPKEIGLEGFDARNTNKNFVTKVNGIPYLFFSMPSNESNLYFVSMISEKEVLEKSQQVTTILIAIYIVTFFTIFLIINLISRRIAKPILEIANVINHMTDFNFNFEDNQNMRYYSKRTDEVGTVSNALIDMHSNFTELMNQVTYIDGELKNIEIKEHNKLKLKVSKTNPFCDVITSMNSLLDKIYLSFQQLKIQIEETNKQKEHILYLAFHDELTGLLNRRKIIEEFEKLLQTNKRGATLLLNVKNFKGINNTLGHMFGDEVIKKIAGKLLQVEQDEGILLSRFSSDEYMILFAENDRDQKIKRYLDKIEQIFAKELKIEDIGIQIQHCVGIALFPEDSIEVSQLLMQVDLAMQEAKSAGNERYKFFVSQMLEREIRKKEIEDILRVAMEEDGFTMLYQPQVNLKTGLIDSYEALVRLKDAKILPGEFIEIAEKTGSIVKIGRITTKKVIQQLQEWKEKGLKLKPVAINFSATQFHDYDYVEFLKNTLIQHNIEASYIKIEITESILLDDTEMALKVLSSFHNMGIQIAIDDFGTGYSSLNYLTLLPVDIVKFDRSINKRFLEFSDTKVMDSLISLVHSLGLVVIAEGIETKDQAGKMYKAGCDYIQGYYFSKPLQAEEIFLIHDKEYTDII